MQSLDPLCSIDPKRRLALLENQKDLELINTIRFFRDPDTDMLLDKYATVKLQVVDKSMSAE